MQGFRVIEVKSQGHRAGLANRMRLRVATGAGKDLQALRRMPLSQPANQPQPDIATSENQQSSRRGIIRRQAKI